MPNGSPKLSMLFARAAWWLDDRDWTVRSALVEALDRSDRDADAAALLAGGRMGLPAVLEMTTQANAAIQLNEGQSVLLEFGSRPRTVPTEEPGIALTEAAVSAAATATAAATPVSSGGGGVPSWLAYLGLAAVLVGVLLLGALVARLLRR